MPRAKESLVVTRIEKEILDNVRLCELRLAAARKLAASCGTLVTNSRSMSKIELFCTRLGEEVQASLGYYYGLQKIEKLAIRRKNEIKQRDLERARIKYNRENPL